MENSAHAFSWKLLATVLRARRRRGAAVLAQELSVDPKALDPSGAASKPKAKKSKQAAAPGATAPNRTASLAATASSASSRAGRQARSAQGGEEGRHPAAAKGRSASRPRAICRRPAVLSGNCNKTPGRAVPRGRMEKIMGL